MLRATSSACEGRQGDRKDGAAAGSLVDKITAMLTDDAE
jgi:hypothetical protein